MSSPSRRNSGVPLADAGPSRSVLQQLLEEINGPDNPPTTFRPTPPPMYIPKSDSRTASVWCGGGSIAQDARAKLRVMDEARQRKMSISSTDSTPEDPAPPPSRRHSTQLGSLFFGTGISVWRPQSYSSKTIQEDAFADSSSSSADSVTPPTSASRESISPKKFVRNSPDFPQLTSKRRRPNTTFGSDGHKHSLSDSTPITTLRGGGDDDDKSLTLFRNSTFTERHSSLVDVTTATTSIASTSSFRPLPEMAFSARTVPTTPIRSHSPPAHVTGTSQSIASTVYTPAWMRPFHLVDDEVSIYKQVHGEQWREAPLCLYCFREHGEFHRLYNDGCETCGRDEELEHHYWEPS